MKDYQREKEQRRRLEKEYKEYREEKQKKLLMLYDKEKVYEAEYRQLAQKKEEWLYMRVSAPNDKTDYAVELFKEIWQKKMTLNDKYQLFKDISKTIGINKPIILDKLHEQARNMVTRHLTAENQQDRDKQEASWLLAEKGQRFYSDDLDSEEFEAARVAAAEEEGDDEMEEGQVKTSKEEVTREKKRREGSTLTNYSCLLNHLEIVCYQMSSRSQIIDNIQKNVAKNVVFLVV